MSIFSPSFSCGARYGDFIYASAFKFNGLIRIGINDGKTEYLLKFPESDNITGCIHSRAYTNGNEIFFIPANGNRIHVFNPNTNEIHSIRIDRNSYDKEYGAIFCKNKIIIFPKFVGGDVLGFDMTDKTVYVMIKWKDIKEYTSKEKKYAFLRVATMGDKVVFTFSNTYLVLIINTTPLTVDAKEVNVKDLNGVYGGEFGMYFTSDNDSSLYLWNPVDNKTKECTVDKELKGVVFTFGIETNRGTVFFPGSSFKYIGVAKNDKVQPLFKLEGPDGKLLYLEPFCDNNEIWALPFDGNELLRISDDEIKRIELQEIEVNSENRKNITDSHILSEGDDLSLDSFIYDYIL